MSRADGSPLRPYSYWLMDSQGEYYQKSPNHPRIKQAIKDARAERQELTDAEIEKIWIEYRAALPRYLCFARAVIRANNTKENS